MWLFKSFLYFLHLLILLKSLLGNLSQRIRRFFSLDVSPCSFRRIRHDSKKFTKLPRHVSFLVLEPEISLKDVAHLMVWSMAMGIPYISIYDREGVLKRNAASLSSEILREKEKMFAEESSKFTFVLRTKESKFDCDLASNQVCVSLLSEEDGKGDIVAATRTFCTEIKQKFRTVKEMEPDLLDTLLKATCDIPDPDVAMKFGDVPMIMGFLPWQIRLTEFLELKTHHSIDYSTFVSCLRRFCHCQQRFGK